MARTDSDLMQLIQARDAAAFEEFFARHRQKVLGYLSRIVRERSWAEDLLQEVFFRVWIRSTQWTGSGNPQSWLFRIAANLALNHIRSRNRRPQMSLEADPATADDESESGLPAWLIDAASLPPDAIAERAERYERLRKIIQDLPEHKREVLHLVYDVEMDISDAAEALGIPEGTVKSRLHKTRRDLARRWKEIEGEL
jgi:RNA polymerase sigma-70 factor (ECF subfamily)